MTMKDQALSLWDDAVDWAKKHPVICCIAASLLAVFVIGYFAGRA